MHQLTELGGSLKQMRHLSEVGATPAGHSRAADGEADMQVDKELIAVLRKEIWSEVDEVGNAVNDSEAPLNSLAALATHAEATTSSTSSKLHSDIKQMWKALEDLEDKHAEALGDLQELHGKLSKDVSSIR